MNLSNFLKTEELIRTDGSPELYFHKTEDFGFLCRQDGELYFDQWHFCRELFHDDLFNKSEYRPNIDRRNFLFYFGHRAKYSIPAFIDKVETRLRLAERTEFCGVRGHAVFKKAFLFKPSSWWLQSSMRVSLLTILMRAGLNYSRRTDNFDEALYSHTYSKNTRYAVRRFMSGHTKYTGTVRGWYSQFYFDGPEYLEKEKPTRKRIDELLVKP